MKVTDAIYRMRIHIQQAESAAGMSQAPNNQKKCICSFFPNKGDSPDERRRTQQQWQVVGLQKLVTSHEQKRAIVQLNHCSEAAQDCPTIR
jgi:hypothetical protein